MGSEIVVGIDPGGTTGVVREEGGVVRSAEIRGLGELRDWIRGADVVVMEDFRGTAGRAVNYRDPLLVIGAVTLICQEEGIRLVLQPPGAGALDRQCAAALVRGRHARDALAHVLRWRRKQRGE